jgi:all-trans-8'-apo-beta-carotenal 15,15'-oxygenase
MTATNNFVFDNRPDDIDSTELELEGTLPAGLRGRFLANGPGRNEINGQKLHPFDAYGRILSAEIDGGSVRLMGKHVQTPLLAQELGQQRMVQRRAFMNKPGRWSNLFDLNLANSCMHNIYPFAGRLMASQDPGQFILDPETLAVTGRFDCGGLLKKGMTATPMARVDPASGHLVLWLQKPGPKSTITIVELDESLAVVQQKTCKVPPGLMHDVAFTSDYYVMSRFAGLDVLKVLWGAAPVASAFKFGDGIARLYLVPRRGGETLEIPLPPRAHFHYFNAFQQDGDVVVDTIGYPGPVTFHALYPDGERERAGVANTESPVGEVVRYRISLDDMSVQERVMPGIVCEAPEVNGAVRGGPYRYGYAAARTDDISPMDPATYAWFSGIGKLDFEKNEPTVWAAAAGCSCSPPAFVPDPEREGEDAGFLLSWIQSPEEKRASLAVFDAQDLSGGPIARAHHPDLFGFISHTSFLDTSA